VREFAVGRPPAVTGSELFRHITAVLTWIWVAAFAGMAVSSLIPPIDAGRATIHDAGSTLSIVCYWVIPFTLLGLAAVESRFLPDRMRAGARRKGALSARRGTSTQRPGRRVEVDADA
jgi:hypothetical protein